MSFSDESGSDNATEMGDLSDAQLAPFEVYKRQFANFREMDAKRKTSLYLLHFEDDSMSILKKVTDPENPDQRSFVDVSDTLQEHFQSNEDLIKKRFDFQMLKQKPDQSIDEFLTELQEKARECDFKSFEEVAICARFREGILNEIIKQRLQADDSDSISTLLSIAKAVEIAMQECKILSTQNSDAEFSDFEEPSQQEVVEESTALVEISQEKCGKCGKEHSGVCPIKHFGCFNCNMKGHSAKMCPNKGKRKSTASEGRVSGVVKAPDAKDYKLYFDEVVCQELVRTLSKKVLTNPVASASPALSERSLSRAGSSKSVASPLLGAYIARDCYKCGEKHEGAICRLKNLRCFYCSFKGHCAKMCPNKNKRYREVEQRDLISDSEDGDDEEDDEDDIDYMHEHEYDEYGVRHACYKCSRQPDVYNTRYSPFRFMRFELPFQTWLPF